MGAPLGRANHGHFQTCDRPLNDAPLRTRFIVLEPGFRGRSGNPLGHRLGPVRLRAPVSSHGSSRLGHGSRGRVSRSGEPRWLPHRRSLFGLGAMLGTLIGGRAADRWGGAHALKMWLAFQAAAVALALTPSTACLFASAFLGGFAGLGVSAVALARARELAGPAAGVVWVRATALYALAQAAAGFVLTPLFAHTGSPGAVFTAGLALSAAALLAAFRDR